MMGLMALAMNPNLDAQQFDKLARKMLEDRESLYKTAFDCAEQMETAEQKLQYLTAVMPILCMF